jgi:hypothetical protein
VAGSLPTHWDWEARISAWSHQALETKIGRGELKGLCGVAVLPFSPERVKGALNA